jgi:uracil-DNA glycosylase family 4
VEVKPDGVPQCPFWLVGEAPGQDEEREGKVFVGAAGRLLNRLLTTAGIPRSLCYITNVSPVRPPNNKFEAFYEDKARKKPTQQLMKFRADLQEQILNFQPKVIVALGEEAMRAVSNNYGITMWRGSILPTFSPSSACVVPTFHPAYLLRGNMQSFLVVVFDLRKAWKELEGKPLPAPLVHVVDNFTQLGDMAEKFASMP